MYFTFNLSYHEIYKFVMIYSFLRIYYNVVDLFAFNKLRSLGITAQPAFNLE